MKIYFIREKEKKSNLLYDIRRYKIILKIISSFLETIS